MKMAVAEEETHPSILTGKAAQRKLQSFLSTGVSGNREMAAAMPSGQIGKKLHLTSERQSSIYQRGMSSEGFPHSTPPSCLDHSCKGNRTW